MAAGKQAAAWQLSLEALDKKLPPTTPLAERLRRGCAAGSCSTPSCGLVSMRHIAKTGGVSVREWMIRLERRGRAQYLGPVTWMRYRGRYCSHGRYLHCCHPSDSRAAAECHKVRLTDARAHAVKLASESMTIGQGGGNTSSGWRRDLLTLLEFHWPDSAVGRWGDPHTFLQMLPAMRPERFPGHCRVVVTTLLRDPARLYPSLQLHLFPAMRGYNTRAQSLDPCDFAGFVAAFPNFQSWRLTSSEWSPLPESIISHNRMFTAATRLLSKFDLVGVTEDMQSWITLLCALAAIVPCPALKHLNQARRSRDDRIKCQPPNWTLVDVAVHRHAHADARLHRWAESRLKQDMAHFKIHH
ncbi:hypothetical protein AB1Y20_019776 [Prymnesium parvum]|uniref:Uncharacterized protein n=1 Tax=Prymnesium parvum TaxID=97485 RepID=A0AB34JVK8_PRYPA